MATEQTQDPSAEGTEEEAERMGVQIMTLSKIVHNADDEDKEKREFKKVDLSGTCEFRIFKDHVTYKFVHWICWANRSQGDDGVIKFDWDVDNMVETVPDGDADEWTEEEQQLDAALLEVMQNGFRFFRLPDKVEVEDTSIMVVMPAEEDKKDKHYVWTIKHV